MKNHRQLSNPERDRILSRALSELYGPETAKSLMSSNQLDEIRHWFYEDETNELGYYQTKKRPGIRAGIGE